MATYTLINSTTLSTAQATVTFSSIPNTFTDLKLVVSARTTRANDVDLLNILLNNDSSALYSQIVMYANGSTLAGAQISGDSSVYYNWIDAATSTTSIFGSSEIYIPSYTSGEYKSFYSFSTQEQNSTTAYISNSSNLYRSTNAISQIRLKSHFDENFIAQSSFYLYGISNA